MVRATHFHDRQDQVINLSFFFGVEVVVSECYNVDPSADNAKKNFERFFDFLAADTVE